MNKYGIILIFVIVLILSACRNRESLTPSTQGLMSQTNEQGLKDTEENTTEDKGMHYENDEIILKNTSIDKTSARNISRILDSLNVQKFKTFNVKKQSESGYEIEVTDVLDYVYYFTLDEKGSLETIREKNKKGKIIYNDIINNNHDIIMQKISTNNLAAWAIAENLNTLNVQKVSDFVVEEEMESGGYCIRLIDELGDIYFLVIDRYGVLVRVHKNSWQDEPIYYMIE